jgi:two-component system, LuxR family, response regulator DctR
MVFIVDDEAPIRDALQWLLKSRGVKSRTFASAAEFQAYRAETAEGGVKPGCVILDIRMPEVSGLELFDQLRAEGVHEIWPVIFLTGHGDVPMAVGSLKNGAYDFFEKPFNDNKLVDRVIDALAESERRIGAAASQTSLATRLAGLTQRERAVMDLIAAGHYNKVIADKLGVSMRTVEVHRAKVFQKLGVRTAVELVGVLQTQRKPDAEP